MRTVVHDVWSPQIFVVCGAISTINCNNEWYITVPGFSPLVVHSMLGYNSLDGVNLESLFRAYGPGLLSSW